jgi:hypothetical protein
MRGPAAKAGAALIASKTKTTKVENKISDF